jgi:hypothetical protein
MKQLLDWIEILNEEAESQEKQNLLMDLEKTLLNHSTELSELLQKQNRRFYSNPIIRKRKTLGVYATLFKELSNNDPEYFFEYLRMTPESFQKLVGLIQREIEPIGPNARIFAEQRTLIAIRFLVSGERFSSLSYQFRVGASTIKIIVDSVCRAIWRNLRGIYMKVPSVHQWKRIAEDFYKLWGMPNCIGAIDGNHTKIMNIDNNLKRIIF